MEPNAAPAGTALDDRGRKRVRADGVEKGIPAVAALDVTELDDRELVGRARGGDERCLEALIARHRNLARAKARSYFLAGSDKDDVAQEAMIGLYKAIRDFNVSHETPFRAFAEICISRQIMTAMKTANRHKHHPLNASVSLDAPVQSDEAHRSVADTLVAPTISDPAELIVSAEEIDGIRATMKQKLTELESEVLRLYMAGKSYEEIAAALGNHVKSIDNALQRTKKKLEKHLATRDTLAS
jgi:RNA polymerase sporulation-specific sigma factor